MKSVLKPNFAVILAVLWMPTAWSQNNQSVYEGFTEPRYDIMVAATEIGRLEEVLVEAGDRVEQGQTIARLEDSLQKSSVEIARLQAQMRGDTEAATAEAMLQQTRYSHIHQLAGEKVARPNELLRTKPICKLPGHGKRPPWNKTSSVSSNLSDTNCNWPGAWSWHRWRA